jgi:hypothetical protein
VVGCEIPHIERGGNVSLEADRTPGKRRRLLGLATEIELGVMQPEPYAFLGGIVEGAGKGYRPAARRLRLSPPLLRTFSTGAHIFPIDGTDE